MTEPAARGTFGATVTQWAIYDAYEEERTNNQQSGSGGVGVGGGMVGSSVNGVGVGVVGASGGGGGGGAVVAAGTTTAVPNGSPVISKSVDTSKVQFTPPSSLMFLFCIPFCAPIFLIMYLSTIVIQKSTEEPRNFIPVAFELLRSKAQTESDGLLGGNDSNNSSSGGDGASFLSKLRIMERMVVQNATMPITMDFKYWDDPADQYQEEGM
jgi:hypothetical protein